MGLISGDIRLSVVSQLAAVRRLFAFHNAIFAPNISATSNFARVQKAAGKDFAQGDACSKLKNAQKRDRPRACNAAYANRVVVCDVIPAEGWGVLTLKLPTSLRCLLCRCEGGDAKQNYTVIVILDCVDQQIRVDC
jgi:hypothetical protein